MQARSVEVRIFGLLFRLILLDSFHSGTYQLNFCDGNITLIIPSAGTGPRKSVACVSLVSSLSVVCAWPICKPIVGYPPHGLPAHWRSIQVASSMSVSVDVLPGIPFCRICQLYTRWHPACPGLHVSCGLFIDGPPALSGFPYTHIKASAIRRLPSVCKSSSGPPASSGFPVVYNSASGIDRPPTILRCIVSQGLPLCRASPYTHIKASGLRRLPSVCISCSGPPASSGFPVIYN